MIDELGMRTMLFVLGIFSIGLFLVDAVVVSERRHGGGTGQ